MKKSSNKQKEKFDRQRKKWEVTKKALKSQITEMRTEIARIEIKHQEKIISSTKPSPSTVESKEMKFIINSHRKEIHELKDEVDKYKKELKDKDHEMYQLK